ncbi:MAG: alpha/beta hydrolase [Candidatus Peribacteraceae bacterium]|jgi:pimeloyl-ACP methyl ester carboxylesterase
MHKPVLLCLHGWGGSKESFTELREALQGANIEMLTPDLPGFGAEPEPATPWTVDQYAAWVEQWVARQSAAEDRPAIYLLGHSHGGRIAIKLAVRGNLQIKHLFLCAAAGIKRPRHIKRLAGFMLAKGGKVLLAIPGFSALKPLGRTVLYKLMRVHDYERASPVMQRTLVNVSSEDLRPILKDIRIPTNIFWGEDDRMTPLADADIMHRLIAGSTLHTFPGVRHGVHRDRANIIAAVIHNTLAHP